MDGFAGNQEARRSGLRSRVSATLPEKNARVSPSNVSGVDPLDSRRVDGPCKLLSSFRGSKSKKNPLRRDIRLEAISGRTLFANRNIRAGAPNSATFVEISREMGRKRGAREINFRRASRKVLRTSARAFPPVVRAQEEPLLFHVARQSSRGVRATGSQPGFNIGARRQFCLWFPSPCDATPLVRLP